MNELKFDEIWNLSLGIPLIGWSSILLMDYHIPVIPPRICEEEGPKFD